MAQTVDEVVGELERNPYQIIDVYAQYSGILNYNGISSDTVVMPALGKWNETPATTLATITREHAKKKISAEKKAVVTEIYPELEGTFVQAGTKIMVLQHYYSKEEVIEKVLRHSLNLFLAPERAKYYFLPEIDKKVHASGCTSIRVVDGMPLFIMSRMKREVTLNYSGPDGIIYSVYFSQAENVHAGAPLIGICKEDSLPQIEGIVTSLQCQWQEK